MIDIELVSGIILAIVSGVLLLAGAFFVLVGGIGVFR